MKQHSIAQVGRTSKDHLTHAFTGKVVQILAQYWQGIHTYLILSKDTGHMCLGKIIIMPILLLLVFFLLLRNFIPLSFKTHNLLLMEFLGIRGSVLFGYRYVGYQVCGMKAVGISCGFDVETRSNFSSCVTEKQHLRFDDCSKYRSPYSVTPIFRLQLFKDLIFKSTQTKVRLIAKCLNYLIILHL